MSRQPGKVFKRGPKRPKTQKHRGPATGMGVPKGDIHATNPRARKMIRHGERKMQFEIEQREQKIRKGEL